MAGSEIIEDWCSPYRRHSSLDYASPIGYRIGGYASERPKRFSLDEEEVTPCGVL